MGKQIRYLMVGGFLGAGKTTAIARIARHYMSQGLKVGLVTNDQATDLVDTYSLRAQGFRVGEVPGACFCCNFNQLIATLAELARDDVPDVIVAEPVGSCTDLVATVIEPLQTMHSDRYRVGPLAVLLKPEHGQKILRREKKAGFSPKAAYIFVKQIEEADIVAINKIDKLSLTQRDELVELVQQQFPGKRIVAVSARDGAGFDELMELLEQPAAATRTRMHVDYDTYADGEAELGWLNCHLTVARRDQDFSLDQLTRSITSALAQRLQAEQAETAHLKVLAQHERGTAISNLVAADAEVELSRAAGVNVPSADVILNARVATAPNVLETLVREAVKSVADADSLDLQIKTLRCFRPGRPVPTHRIGSADS